MDSFEEKMFELDMEAFVSLYEDRNFEKPWEDRIKEILHERKNVDQIKCFACGASFNDSEDANQHWQDIHS